MLPSGSWSGPLVGSLYRTFSPKPRMYCAKFLPLILNHGVNPSSPRDLAFKIVHVCSKSHGMSAWDTGTYLSILASKQSFRVLNNPLTSLTPISVAPFDLDSYLAGSSLVTRSPFSNPALSFSTTRSRSACSAFSLSPLRII